MSCLALCKDNTRCRNYARLEQESDGRLVRLHTCARHASFFDNPEALKLKLLKGRRVVYLEFDTLRFLLKDWLTEGLLVYGYQDFDRALFHHVSPNIGQTLAFFMLTVAQHNLDGFHPTWNRPLWEHVVRWLWSKKFAYGPYIITDGGLASLLCVKGMSGLFEEGCALYRPPAGLEDDPMDWPRFLDHVCRIQPAWAEEWLHTTAAGAQFAAEWRAARLADWRSEKRFRIEAFKEDLIAAGWRTERFLNWCVDWEEVSDLKKTWRLE